MEVELLEQIVKNTTHNTSFQIIVSDNKSYYSFPNLLLISKY